jgi:hypothetical protein
MEEQYQYTPLISLFDLGLLLALQWINYTENDRTGNKVLIGALIIPRFACCCLNPGQAFQLHGHLYTLYLFSLFWEHVFFAFHNLGTFCRGELLKLV